MAAAFRICNRNDAFDPPSDLPALAPSRRSERHLRYESGVRNGALEVDGGLRPRHVPALLGAGHGRGEGREAGLEAGQLSGDGCERGGPGGGGEEEHVAPQGESRLPHAPVKAVEGSLAAGYVAWKMCNQFSESASFRSLF